MLMKGERPGPTAALIGQEAGSSVSSSKWRHVRPVSLQLGPDCFPEALEASPCLWAHHGGRMVHPTVSGPDLSWHETGPFSYWAHAGEEWRVHAQTLSRKRKWNTAMVDVFKPVHSCIKFASTGFSVFSFAYNYQGYLRSMMLWSWRFKSKCCQSLFLDNNKLSMPIQ